MIVSHNAIITLKVAGGLEDLEREMTHALEDLKKLNTPGDAKVGVTLDKGFNNGSNINFTPPTIQINVRW